MSEHPTFDRAKGFVALPVEVLELDLTPGAFRLLVELCRMANLDGYCWPSLAQLSDRLGRSRSAISGYVKALRDAGLLTTQEQKTSNGYNYRLKYHVTFWAQWRADIAGTTRTKNERSVQPAERLSKDKNQINLNQVKGACASEIRDLVLDWTHCFKGAPYPLCQERPSQALLAKTRGLLTESPKTNGAISADIIGTLRQLWSDIGIAEDPKSEQQQAAYLRQLTFDAGEIQQVADAIKRAWPSHWNRMPAQKQFEKLVKATKVNPASAQLKVLRGYQKRWQLAQKYLPRPAQSGLVNRNENTAFNVAV